MSAPTIAERVAAGVAWLDRYRSGWWKPEKIDLAAFDIGSSCGCILGQLEGDYWDSSLVRRHGDAKAVALGFNSQWRSERGKLQDEWRRVISDRRAQTAGASS